MLFARKTSLVKASIQPVNACIYCCFREAFAAPALLPPEAHAGSADACSQGPAQAAYLSLTIYLSIYLYVCTYVFLYVCIKYTYIYIDSYFTIIIIIIVVVSHYVLIINY